MRNHLTSKMTEQTFPVIRSELSDAGNRICFGPPGRLEGQLGKLAEQKTKLGIVIDPCFRLLGHKSFCVLPISEPI
jgi:hypothetical protein